MGRLPAATAVVEGPGFPRIDSQACRRSPLSEDTQGSSVGHFFPWSQSVTDKALVAWVCRMGWGVGWSRKHLAPRLKGSLRHQPALPPHLRSQASLAAGTGQFFGHRETEMLWAHLRLLIHLCTRPAHTLPTADSIENLTLSGWRGRGEDRMAWEAAMSLLTCFFKELTALESFSERESWAGRVDRR